jgi:hypothetical protein
MFEHVGHILHHLTLGFVVNTGASQVYRMGLLMQKLDRLRLQPPPDAPAGAGNRHSRSKMSGRISLGKDAGAGAAKQATSRNKGHLRKDRPPQHK